MATTLPQIRIGAVLALAVVVAFGAWLAVGHKRGGRTTTTAMQQQQHQQSVTPSAVSAQGLRTIAGTLGQPIYWAGPENGVHYELTQTPDGRIYVRYLPKGVAAGSRNPYLTVATYPVANAFAATSGVAKRPTSVRIEVGGGTVAFYSPARPTNVYEAFPGSDYQIEVYAPSATRAQQLVAGRVIRPVGKSGATTPQTAAVSPRTVRVHRATSLVKPGETGPAVTAWQKLINKWLSRQPGQTKLPVTGTFGRATTSATIALQRVEGLPTDGVVGAATRSALSKALRGS